MDFPSPPHYTLNHVRNQYIACHLQYICNISRQHSYDSNRLLIQSCNGGFIRNNALLPRQHWCADRYLSYTYCNRLTCVMLSGKIVYWLSDVSSSINKPLHFSVLAWGMVIL